MENKIPASKNHKFLHLLFNSNDAEDTLATFQLTIKGFEEKYKTKFEEVKTNPTHDATGGRGKDTLKSGILKIKSEIWVKSFNTIFNMFMELSRIGKNSDSSIGSSPQLLKSTSSSASSSSGWPPRREATLWGSLDT